MTSQGSSSVRRRDQPATDAQCRYIRRLGGELTPGLTIGQAAASIDTLKAASKPASRRPATSFQRDTIRALGGTDPEDLTIDAARQMVASLQAAIDLPEGERPMTVRQVSFLRQLCEQTGAEFQPHLSRRAAQDEIGRLAQLRDAATSEEGASTP